MPKTYTTADSEVTDLLEDVLDHYHADLVEAETTISVIMVHAARHPETGEPLAPALKVHGQPAAARVKVNGLAARVEGLSDATVTIDADRWQDLSHASRRALLDHEATHLVLIRDEDGNLKSDDAGRPLLKCQPDEIAFTGFTCVIERHGMAALEAQSIVTVYQAWRSLCLWDEEVGGEPARSSSVHQAVRDFADKMKASGTTVTIEAGGQSATIGAGV